jgi:hypothetical protein
MEEVLVLSTFSGFISLVKGVRIIYTPSLFGEERKLDTNMRQSNTRSCLACEHYSIAQRAFEYQKARYKSYSFCPLHWLSITGYSVVSKGLAGSSSWSRVVTLIETLNCQFSL